MLFLHAMTARISEHSRLSPLTKIKREKFVPLPNVTCQTDIYNSRECIERDGKVTATVPVAGWFSVDVYIFWFGTDNTNHNMKLTGM